MAHKTTALTTELPGLASSAYATGHATGYETMLKPGHNVGERKRVRNYDFNRGVAKRV